MISTVQVVTSLSPVKKSLTASHSSPLKSTSSVLIGSGGQATPHKLKLAKSSSSSESEDSGEETDLSDFI